MARFRWTLTFLWCFCTSLAYGASVPATASHLLADGIGKFISQGVLQGALGTFDAVLRIEQRQERLHNEESERQLIDYVAMTMLSLGEEQRAIP